jgi:hypothetical protein
MHPLVRSTIFAFAAVASFVAPSGAQSIASSSQPPLPAADSIFQRARRLVSEGDGATGRAVIDSMLRAATEGTPA